ncbi:hypothetical protein B0T17DRAFT_611620 [Bombardia bombarda]|uniref:WW domain-containing protein n=1 Tax=Bombardia bombarda TaxID=252184 RepID=A0AA39XJ64_9PEZI|nr:hypothetical protein B0T17DRAFT_611620 [Bombardia bombarda]
MADYFDAPPPPGPPPPKVPEGWIAKWNEQYKEWFYVNTYTKKSQWDKPTEPARAPAGDAPAGPPPTYTPGDKPAPSDTKVNPYDDPNNRGIFGPSGGGSSSTQDEDARLARQLQDEENARARSHGTGSAAGYMNTPPLSSAGGSPSPYPNQLPPRPDLAEKGKGIFGKLFGGKKPGSMGGGGYGGGYPAGGGYGSPQPQAGYGQQQGYGGAPGYGGGYPPQQGAYGGNYGGGYPPQQQGGYYGQQQQGYGGGGYGGGGNYGRPQKSGGGGMGMAGGAALGLGAGLIGGAIIADQIQDHEQEAYQEGYQDGDMGGGDDGGGDF